MSFQKQVKPSLLRRWKESRFELCAVAPATAIIACLMFYPLLYNAWVSFRYLTLVNFRRGGAFTGIENYVSLLSDPSFHNSVRVTVIYVLLTVTIQIVISFGIAMVVYKGRERLRRITTLCLLLPRMVTPVSASLVFRFMLNYETGIVNYLLGRFDLPRLPFFSEPILAMASLIFIGVWQHVGFDYLLIMTGLMGISEQMIEAAEVDGANWWSRVRHIIIPLLKPVLIVVVLFGAINSFQVFDFVYMTTGGGPGGTTEVVGIYLYRKLLLASEFGYSAALSVVLLAISLLMSVTLIRALRRESI